MAVIYDAAIIGAGPAGSFAAYLLARAGKKVLLLDKNKLPVRKVCGEYLCPQGVKLLERRGADCVLAGALPIYGMKIVTASNLEVVARFPGGEAGRAVSRKILDQHLVQLARSHGADFRSGLSLDRMLRKDGVWRVLAGSSEFSAKLVIGADGRGSRVSKIFNNDLATGEKRVAIHCFVNANGENERFGEMHMFNDGSYIGVDPTGPREVNLSLVSDAGLIQSLGGPARALSHYLNLSANLQPRFGLQLINTPLTTTYPIQHRTKSTVPAVNVALVGDAAGFVDPLTGEGMFNALRSAELLCEAALGQSTNPLSHYKRSYVKHLRGKTRLNRLFQWLLRKPWLVEPIAKFLLRKEPRADTFIGIIGNIYSPREGISRLLF